MKEPNLRNSGITSPGRAGGSLRARLSGPVIMLVLTFLASVSFAEGTSAQAQPVGKSTPKPAPKIKLDNSDYNWGKVLLGETVTHTYKVRNEGSAPLRITKVRPSCGCSATTWTKTEIPPGESGVIELSVDTEKLRGGVTKKNATVFTNDRSAPNLQIFIGGEVLTIAKASVDQIKIVGLAAEPKITNIELEPGTDKSFDIVSVTSRYKHITLDSAEVIDPGKRYRLHLKVAAAIPGIKPDTLEVRVRTKDDTEHLLAIPATIEHQYRISVTPTSGIVFRRNETDALLAPDAKPISKSVVVESSRPDIKFEVTRVTVDGPQSGVFETKIEALEPGLRYQVTVTINGHFDQRFARGKLAIRTTDPESPLKEVRVFAQFQAKKK